MATDARSAVKAPPVLRKNPTTPDGDDGARVALVLDQRWRPQDQLLYSRYRQIEENVRCLAGRQWDVWSPVNGQYIEPTRYMTTEEKRWRQRPVVNLLAYWFMLTHARLTENTPAVTFQPATADHLDELLAQTLTPIFKTVWSEAGMDEGFARAVAWMIASGEVYGETAVDFEKGDPVQRVGPAVLSMDRGEGQEPIQRVASAVPYDADGNPMAELQAPEEEGSDDYGYSVTGSAPAEKEGCIAPRIRSPLEVRAEWGAEGAWEDKRWITTLSYLSPDEVAARYNVTCVPDTLGGGDAGFLERLLFSAGHFGASNQRDSTTGGVSASVGNAGQPLVAVYAMWEKPCAGFPDGRLLVCTRDHVLWDGPRPFQTKAAGPIRRAQFVMMPGRGGFGSTPLEQMIPVQKAYNRGWAQILEHRNLVTNPILITDASSGIGDQMTNVPGARIEIDMQQGVPNPAYYLTPPALSADVWRTQSQLRDELFLLGSMADGTAAPTDDPSGELISQLRYNADRPVAVAARSLAYWTVGLVEDWVAILPSLWTNEKVLAYAGEDQIYRTISVLPEMWDGAVNVRPDLVNARLESPEVKEQRAMALYTAGALGLPGSPEANDKLFQLAKFPNVGRFGEQGGPDAASCRRALGKLAQGADVSEILLLPWYDYGVWIKLTRDHLASPEYLDYEPDVQQVFAAFFIALEQAQTQAGMIAAAVQAPRAAVMAQAQGAVAHVAQQSMPEPPPDPQSATGPDSAGHPDPQQAA